jgi:hypothetical protein
VRGNIPTHHIIHNILDLRSVGKICGQVFKWRSVLVMELSLAHLQWYSEKGDEFLNEIWVHQFAKGSQTTLMKRKDNIDEVVTSHLHKKCLGP